MRRHDRRLKLHVLLFGVVTLPFFGGCTEKYALREQAQERMISNLQAEKRKLREERDEAMRLRESLQEELDEKDGILAAVRRDNAQLQNELATKPAAQPAAARSGLEDERGVSVRTLGGATVISLESGVTFASGKADLSQEGKRILKRVAREIRSTYAGHRVWVEGHTDNEPIKKSAFRSNLELSLARGLSVYHYLTKSCGVSESQLVVAGHGEHNPIGSNRDSKDRARNRRVQLVVARPQG